MVTSEALWSVFFSGGFFHREVKELVWPSNGGGLLKVALLGRWCMWFVEVLMDVWIDLSPPSYRPLHGWLPYHSFSLRFLIGQQNCSTAL